MTLSLRELKEYLIAKEGYTISPSHSQLADLKALVEDMMNVRSESPPSYGSGYYSGTNCIGHQNISDFKLSLGDINALDIKGCSCNTVNDKTAYCRSRTYTCSCNSNIPTCTCNSRTAVTCDCQDRTSSCRNYFKCEGDYGGTSCFCQDRVSTGCSCDGYQTTCTCNSRTPEPCNCQNRTSSCGSRNTTSCTCNGRCACNAEKRFS